MTEDKLILSGEAFLNAPVIDTCFALEIHGITDAQKVKAKLISLYGEDASVCADGKTQKLKNAELNAKKLELGAVKNFCKARYNIADAIRVTERLARDGDGCPWDRVQTHESIRINLIEEAYEAVDAIDKHDIENMTEEFGDILLQSVLQSDIARRAGEFDFNDVCDGLCKKLISRHTFIFGDDSASDADEALALWEKAKGKEKNYNDAKEQLKKLPDTFPALLLAQKTHKKLKKAGVKCDPRAMLEKAVAEGDYVKALAASAALLADEGRDAEVELNKMFKAKIASL